MADTGRSGASCWSLRASGWFWAGAEELAAAEAPEAEAEEPSSLDILHFTHVGGHQFSSLDTVQRVLVSKIFTRLANTKCHEESEEKGGLYRKEIVIEDCAMKFVVLLDI